MKNLSHSKHRSHLATSSIRLVAALLLADSAQAAPVIHTMTSGGANNWSSAVWSPVGTPNAAGDTATYNPSVAATATTLFNNTVTIGSISTTSASAWTINGDAVHTMTLDNTGGDTNAFGNSNASLLLNAAAPGSLNLASNHIFIMQNTDLDIGIISTATTGTITTAGGIRSNDGSLRTLNFINNATNSARSITFGTTIGAAGTGSIAVVNKGSGAGAVTLSGAIGSASGAAVTISNTSTGSGLFKITGNVLASVSSITQNSATSTMQFTTGTNTNTGATTISAGTLQFGDGSNTTGSLNPSSAIVNNGNFTISRGNSVTQGTHFGTISGSGSVTRSGSGTNVTFNAANTYTGATYITSGSLVLTLAGTIDNSSKVSVSSGATFNTSAKTSGYTVKGLEGSGTVLGLLNQAVTVGSGGTLAPGDSGVGTLTISAGNLTLANNTTYSLEIGGTTASPVNDLVNLTGSSSTVSLSGSHTLSLFNLGTVDPTGKTFVLMDSVSSIATAGTWTIDYGSTGWTGGTVAINGGDSSQLIFSGLTVVPEPAPLPMLVAGAAMFLVLRRRRPMPGI